MKTTITARHCEISDTLRQRAESVTERLSVVALHPIDASVIFDQDGPSCTAELQFRVARDAPLIASAAAEDHRTALDRAEEKMRRQIQRSSGRVKTGRRLDAPQS
ncbi:MAG TPA: HPF/RaiA family ribosome-associated protein [Gemmatimonadales bacterium]|jgi:ribosome-associated translation inhibitor RaiA|nr:HPF/RaiA family ribosome-associated protein [Gemmatimonadales bacterium]